MPNSPTAVTSPAKLRTAQLPFSQDLARDIENLAAQVSRLHASVSSPGSGSAAAASTTYSAGAGGAVGATGPQGPAGPQGAAGPPGANGVNGSNGNTILNGTTAPANSLGNNGDFYLNTATVTLFGPKANGAWPSNGSALASGGGLPSWGPTSSGAFNWG